MKNEILTNGRVRRIAYGKALLIATEKLELALDDYDRYNEKERLVPHLTDVIFLLRDAIKVHSDLKTIDDVIFVEEGTVLLKWLQTILSRL